MQEQLSDSAVHTNPALAKKLNRRYAELSAIMSAEANVIQYTEDLAAAKELAKEDEAFAEELPNLEAMLKEANEKLRRLET
ncbi:MAG: peptide chain release factor 1 [Actinomycetota bacterium]